MNNNRKKQNLPSSKAYPGEIPSLKLTDTSWKYLDRFYNQFQSKYEATGTAAIVIPQSTAGMSFKVVLAGGGTYTAAIPSDPGNFAANTAYTYTLKLKANDISISAQINPWTAGTDGTGDANLQ